MITQSLLLLLAANGAPIVAWNLLHRHLAWSVDGGLNFFDGHPLFGQGKTWRGIIAAVVACTLLAPFLDLPLTVAALFGLYAMVGDLLASFIKRRLAIAPHSMALGLDQIPEALLPLWLLRQELSLDATAIITCVLLFFLVELSLSRVLYKLHLRKRPF